MAQRYYGWRRQPRDERDWRFTVPRRVTAALPPAVDLSASCPPADNQGQLGACGPNSADVLLRYDMKVQGLSVFNTSRLFTYYNTRQLMGTLAQDSGVDNRTLLKALAQFGYCPENLWPYDISRFKDQPPQSCYTAALPCRISNYAAVAQDLDQMRGTLASGHCFLFGAEVFPEIEGEQVAQTGVVPLPRPGETPVGGHDVVFCGYDDSRQAFKFEMPWGPSWGQNGFGWWPYEYATNPGLASDFWVVNAVPGGVTPGPQPTPTPTPAPTPTPSPQPPPPSPWWPFPWPQPDPGSGGWPFPWPFPSPQPGPHPGPHPRPRPHRRLAPGEVPGEGVRQALSAVGDISLAELLDLARRYGPAALAVLEQVLGSGHRPSS